jgi:DNA-binding SARP family transcriptional activator
MRFHALETLVQRLIGLERYGDAMDVALSSLRGEPLRESAHRAVISVHIAEGNPCEALRHYRGYRDLLRSQLGLEPSDLIKRMVNAIDSAAQSSAPIASVTAAAPRSATVRAASLDAIGRPS